MAILKIKQLITDLQDIETKVMTGPVGKATSSGYSGTVSSAAYATTSGQAGTTFSLTAVQLRSLFNRVIAGSGGTSAQAIIGTGGTVGQAGGFGIRITNELTLMINGRQGTATSAINLNVPIGTQSAATYVKYLVSTGFGSSGTVTAGNEAATSTAALLPDLPADHCAVGYVEFAAHATNPWIRGADATKNRQPAAALTGSTSTPTTAGTVNAWQDLLGYPYSQ